MAKTCKSVRKICNGDIEFSKKEREDLIDLRDRSLLIAKGIDEKLGSSGYNYGNNYTEQEEFTWGIELPNIVDLEKEVLRYIIGQDQQVRRIIIAIYRAIKLNIKANIVIIGKSGTGKSEIIRQVTKRLGLPYTIEDATKYTQEGYEGANVNEMILHLLENADYDLEVAQRGVLVIDEIDKKADTGADNDVSGSKVLASLLKSIEGSVITIPDPRRGNFSNKKINFRTDDLIVVLAGAFLGIEEIRKKRLNQNEMGFMTKKDNPVQNLQDTKYIKQDLIDYGMTDEFVGRTDTIVEMETFGTKELVEILKRSELSIFKKYKHAFKKMGIKIVYNNSIFSQIAKKTLASNTGARDLANTVNDIFENICYDIFANPGKYRKCRLLNGIVEDNRKYILS